MTADFDVVLAAMASVAPPVTLVQATLGNKGCCGESSVGPTGWSSLFCQVFAHLCALGSRDESAAAAAGRTARNFAVAQSTLTGETRAAGLGEGTQNTDLHSHAHSFLINSVL